MSNGVEAYKLFRQLEERKKRANPYKFYDKDELIDEILKNEDEIERLNKALLDIKEYIETHKYTNLIMATNKQFGINGGKELLDIVNKSLGSE